MIGRGRVSLIMSIYIYNQYIYNLNIQYVGLENFTDKVE